MDRNRPADAQKLRDAADVVKEYSSKPGSVWCLALVKMLQNAADGIEREGREAGGRNNGYETL